MRRSSVKKSAAEKESRHGLKDMFVDRPGGDAGIIKSIVWGNSEAEFDEIIAREAIDRQRRSPGLFANKIKPRMGYKAKTGR